MEHALFDPITNSEAEMIAQAHIAKYHALTYLRAHIMASLCFNPQFVVSDTTVNLNRAFRALFDYSEGEGYYKIENVPKADFEWLVQEGHVRFAARENLKGNLFTKLRKSQLDKQAVDLPSEKYVRRIDEICSDQNIYWYALEDISKKFSSKFMDGITKELDGGSQIPPERAAMIRKVIRELSGKETFTYSDVKKILLEGRSEKAAMKEPTYRHIRQVLRQSYDYNVPEELKMDYCMPLQGMKPSRDQDWRLRAGGELRVDGSLLCNVYGFSELPAKRLEDIWHSSEYEAFTRQVSRFRAGDITLENYAAALEKYLQRINEVVRDSYAVKHNVNHAYEGKKLSNIPVAIRHYFMADDICVVIPKVVSDVWDIASLRDNFAISLLEKVFFKVFPVLAKKRTLFPDPPEEMNEAVILQKPEGKESSGGKEAGETPPA